MILLFILIESFFILVCVFLSKKHKISNTDSNKPTITKTSSAEDDIGDEQNTCYSNLDTDYYFDNYTKHITIYKNGHGIIMNTFTVTVCNPENFKEFKRKINIEDGKNNVCFPTLSEMKKIKKENRFEDFGFWTCKYPDSIIESTIEKYWSDNDPDEIDYKSQQNPKELRWIFKINNKKIQKKF